ncbi:MAG: nuclear transport factor 2 family protein [Chthoniobacterales bacterium]
MKRFASVLFLLALVSSAFAQTSAPATAELTKLLNDFLAGASRNDVAMHERFWADELIYTASSGRRKGKAEIMRELRAEEKEPKKDEPETTYSAEDIRIQQFGDTAIVAFRLVGKTGQETKNYLNTGTFLKRNGEWRAVAWQATVLPKPGEAKPQ